MAKTGDRLHVPPVCPKTGLPDFGKITLREVVAAARPVSATVIGEFTPRGGMHSKITAHWSKQRGR